MHIRTTTRIALLFFAVLFLTGCPFVDSQMLEASREYFPECFLLKPRPDVIQVETKVGNISQKFAGETFRAMLERQGQKLSGGLAMAGYRFFILGFDDFNVVWDTARPQSFWVLDRSHFRSWWYQTFGALPDPSQIQRIE